VESIAKRRSRGQKGGQFGTIQEERFLPRKLILLRCSCQEILGVPVILHGYHAFASCDLAALTFYR
jgi:hypothetical protein